jgi:hypothetical protein
MIFGKQERLAADFHGVLGKCAGTSESGWKLAHIDAVGLGGRGELSTYSSSELQGHFRRFMAPANMFVVPAEWGGLAETAEFIVGFREAGATHAP